MYPLPFNEAERLGVLRDLRILGTAPNAYLDAICRTAAALFGTPMALVSLVEEDQQWFKAKCGLEVDGTAREVAFCTYAILSAAVLVVEDATKDERFAQNPLVTGAPHIRFYAGAPLVLSPDIHVGTLCIIDTVPRSLSNAQQCQLKDLAELVVAQLRLHRVEGQLRQSEAQFRLLAENTSDMIVWCDLDSTRRYVSPAAKALLGYAPEELVGTRPRDFVHPDDIEEHDRILSDLGEGRVEQAVGRQRYRRKDGSWVWVEVTFSRTRTAEGGHDHGYVASVRDITERKEAEHRIEHLARHDALTDLPNRTLLSERLVQAIALAKRQGASFAVFCLDLDGFKTVNDTFGHQTGDALLRMVAARLKEVVRAEDTVARIGGDEFVIIQTGAGQPETGSVLAKRLIQAMEPPFAIDGGLMSVRLSIGIALVPQHGVDSDTIYRSADLALYRAKAEGRNTFRFASPEYSSRDGSLKSLRFRSG
ncbi:diguanylate cyclase domain-containing protein [uncultured Methylobacterium sp.]|uniref:diguanylate cyclase domain-containing protein n=1 Tax=uncultured Methylobacterium sp. TaxID=157278 RepID=UPI0035CBE91D